MAVQYRAARNDEAREVMNLWTTVFAGAPEWFFQSSLDAEPKRKPHQTLVAVDRGRIVSALQYFIRPTRSLDGSVKKMGGIGNVATLDEARKQGHSGKLLEMSCEKMAKDGCEWSMLFTGVNNHYERYGWKTIKTRHREGSLAGAGKHDDSYLVLPIVPGDEPNWWRPFSRIYTAFNKDRALTHVRSQSAWELAILPRLNQPEMVVYVAWPQDCGEIAGYAAASTTDKALQLQEIGVTPGSEDALAPMLDVVRELAVHRNVSKVVANVPFEKPLNAALTRLMKAPKITIDGSVMVRSLSDKFPQAEVEKAFAIDGPHFWPLDGF